MVHPTKQQAPTLASSHSIRTIARVSRLVVYGIMLKCLIRHVESFALVATPPHPGTRRTMLHASRRAFQSTHAPIQRRNCAASPFGLDLKRPSVSLGSSKSEGESAPMASFSTMVPDQSAAAQSRAPFSMPKQSPDDSQLAEKSNAASAEASHVTWNQLGLWTELVTCLESEMNLAGPTVVQQMVLPPLLQLGAATTASQVSKHVAFLAATGSGKTLAYCLPVMQLLKQDEVFGSLAATSSAPTTSSSAPASPPLRPKQRPRAVILAPTRELCLQISRVSKQLSHHIKLSVAVVTGGDGMGAQRKLLESRPIDVVVATPGRLYKHVQAGTIVLTNKHVRYVVLDEMDTMLEQGFASDLQHLLYPLLYHKRPSADVKVNPETDVVPDAPSIFLTSATMTQTIQKMIGDQESLVNAKKHHAKSESPASGTADAKVTKLPPMILPRMKVFKAPGLHKAVPRLQQVFVDTAAVDKLSLLIDVLSSQNRKQADSLTMVFCNTAVSCRAVEFALAEARIEKVLSYHGELNSAMRAQHLQQFRDGTATTLVCTDLAARGLDIPAVDHVVMFDFPLNALDYLHRSGRTARGIRNPKSRPGNGKVTALVSKRDQVLANAISQAVQRGEALDGLSSRKTDYLPGGRLNVKRSASNSGKRNSFKPKVTSTTGIKKKAKPKDTTMKKRSATSR